MFTTQKVNIKQALHSKGLALWPHLGPVHSEGLWDKAGAQAWDKHYIVIFLAMMIGSGFEARMPFRTVT